MRVKLNLVMVLSLAAVATAAGQSERAIRFAAMDANRDGVITRDEWRGSAQSFRTHDWNNDGVLSGDEVRVGARRSTDPREPDPFDSDQRDYQFTDWTAGGFTALDHDRNGRVTRDEWHFDLEDFRRADHNRDGCCRASSSSAEIRRPTTTAATASISSTSMVMAACLAPNGMALPIGSRPSMTIATAC